MSMNPWEAIEKQRNNVIDDPPCSIDEFKKPFTEWDFFEEAFSGSQEDTSPRIPTTYYTKPCAWASDYPFSYRRVLVFLNPGGLADPQFNGSLDEYIRREFGCSKNTFIKLVADGWIYPMLTTKEDYPTGIQKQIVRLFDQITRHNEDAVPRFVNLVDYALGAGALTDSTDTSGFAKSLHGEFIDLDETYETWAELLPWSNLPRTEFIHRGVRHSDFREYVTERAVKLELAARYFSNESAISLKADSLREQARNWEMKDHYAFPPIAEELKEEVEIPPLLRDTYTAWNLLGTPMYYCDFSGTTDMGRTVAYEYGNYIGKKISALKSVATKAKRLTSYSVNNIDPSAIGFRQKEGVNLKTLLAIDPDTQMEYKYERKELPKRIEQHDQYYSEMRDELLDIRNDSSLSTYNEVISQHNERTSSGLEFGSILAGQAQKVVKWSDAGTLIFTGIQPLLPSNRSMKASVLALLATGKLAGAYGASLAGNIVGYMGHEKVDRYDIPVPESSNNIDLGPTDFWQVNYSDHPKNQYIRYLEPER